MHRYITGKDIKYIYYRPIYINKIHPSHYNVSDRPLNDDKTLLKNRVDNPSLGILLTEKYMLHVTLSTNKVHARMASGGLVFSVLIERWLFFF